MFLNNINGIVEVVINDYKDIYNELGTNKDFILNLDRLYEENSYEPTVSDIEKSIVHFKKFLNSSKKEKVITKNYKNDSLDITSDGTNTIYYILKNNKDSLEKGVKSALGLGKLWRIYNHNEEYEFKDDIYKKIEELGDLGDKIVIELCKEISFTDSELTKETAINQDWLATKNEIQLLSETASTFTTESASNFISNIKSFFSNSLLGINNAISNFMKTYTITDKYFKDNVNMLNSKNSIIVLY